MSGPWVHRPEIREEFDMKFIPVLGVLSVAATMGLAFPAVAQDNSNMSADELRQLFQKQKTRGLMITPGTAPTAAGTPAVADSATPAATADATYVELPQAEQVNIQIHFDFDSAALKASEKPKLAALCEAMKTSDVKLFKIVGHTDSSGSATYNEHLSLLRAEEVKRSLVSDCGIDAAKLEAVGVGEAHPFDEANPRADVNRRVEFQALS
jgi:OOP family OmpA-OmpF porin